MAAVVGVVVGIMPATAAESVRVDASTGAPRIVVDGQPVRARVFFGLPGSGTLRLESDGQLVSFQFTSQSDETAATMHFRFGQTPGDVYLDDIGCVDLETGQEVFPTATFENGDKDFHESWTLFPPDATNTVGVVTVEPGKGRDGSAGLHVALKSPQNGQWPDFHLYHHTNLVLHKGHRYRVTMWARSTPARSNVAVAFYRPGSPYRFLGGPPNTFYSQIRMAADAGVDIVSFSLGLPWPKPGEAADWTSVDDLCRTILETNPHALLLPRIGTEPPSWWYEKHPDARMVWDPAVSARSMVVASPDYRRDAAERLSALVAHLESTFGNHMAGYHPCGQNTGEWFYEGTWDLPLNGYSNADRQAWRNWLKTRYRDDAALQSAWRDPQARLESAETPSAASRRASPAGVLRDPAAERSLIDFAEFQQQMMAECVCHLAHAVREASHGRRLVVFFYGYLFEFGAVPTGPAVSGHYALRRVLDCPDVDVLCSPISYFDRGLGKSAPSMSAAESVALAGKMWLDEDDTRTYLAGADAGYDVVDTVEKTNQELLRNTGQCALRNFGTWWMDLPALGWFNDPRLWAEMTRLKKLDEPLLKTPRPFRPEVAAVIDEASIMRTSAIGHQATLPLIYHVRAPLGRMGSPYGQYLQDDVAEGRVNAKTYVFLNAWRVTPADRRRLLDATRGKLRLWCYAPGFHEENATSLDAMHELTGFRMKQLKGVAAWAEPTEAGRKLGLNEGFGVKNAAITPSFAVADASADEILATYPDGSAAVAMRRTDQGRSLFVGPPYLTSSLLRLAAREAGVHLVTQTDCNVWSNGPYFVLHASSDGPLEIDTGLPGKVSDVLSGDVLGDGPKLTLPLHFGETRILEVRGK
jgi:hypothetical protein